MAKCDKANEIARERTRIWNKSHPDEHRKHCRDYARRHPDRVRERIKKCNDKKRTGRLGMEWKLNNNLLSMHRFAK